MDTLMRSILTAGLIMLAAVLTACSRPPSGTSESAGSFHLYVLQGTWDSLRLGYDREISGPVLQQVYSSTIIFTVTTDDVAAYDWADQVITLTPQASGALLAAATDGAAPREYPDIALDQRAFVVAVDGEPVYGGVFLAAGSSLAIEYPVIHAAWSGDQMTLKLQPAQLPWTMDWIDPQWCGIKDDRIRAIFAAAGKLVE